MPKKALANRKIIFIVISVIVLALLAFFLMKPQADNPDSQVKRKPTPIPEPVNVIPVQERPYVELQPATERNTVKLTIHELIKPADTVEVTLEYDRNQGVLDAVLKQFNLAKFPYTDLLFLGSKSAGGHVTYHDDVIGGALTLKFTGDNRYTLKVPWLYRDDGAPYSELSLADDSFSLSLDKPITDAKVILMQSPGAPQALDALVVAGPYVLRSVNPLPNTQATLVFKLESEVTQPSVWGWDGTTYQPITDVSLEGTTLTATTPLYQAFLVTSTP